MKMFKFIFEFLPLKLLMMIIVVSDLVNCDESNDNIAEIFRKLEIVPDILNVAPEQTLKVTYANNVSVDNGNELTPTQVKDMPTTIEWKFERNAFYTLMLVDPDAPSRENPTARSWQHWVLKNIPGPYISAGECLSQYIGAGPPQGTGLHRYTFLLFKQPSKMIFEEQTLGRSLAHRAKFSVLNFSEIHNLGNPVAGNVFQAQYDDYVPILYSELKN